VTERNAPHAPDAERRPSSALRFVWTPGGEYTSECRAADITEVDPHDPTRVGLFVKSPTGLFFQSLADGGCAYDEGALDAAQGTPTTRSYPGGTWHWPERV
jgi:hypothetical protein